MLSRLKVAFLSVIAFASINAYASQFFQSNWPTFTGVSTETKTIGCSYMGDKWVDMDTKNWYILSTDCVTWLPFVYPSVGGGASSVSLLSGSNTIGAVNQAGAPWSMSVTNWPATQPVSLSSLPSLPNGTNTIGAISNTSFGVSALPSLPSGSNNIGSVNVASLPALSLAGLRPFEAICTFTRPSSVTIYTAGQVLSTATSGLTSFPACAFGIGNNQRFTINNAQVISSNGSAATKGTFALELFSAASPAGGGFNDGATFAPTSAALSASGNALIGAVPNLFILGSAVYGYQLNLGTPGFQGQTDSSGNMYDAVIVSSAYTSIASEVFTIKVNGTY